MKERLFTHQTGIKVASVVAKTAGLDISDDRDVRVLCYLLCVVAFTDLPKGAKKQSWQEYVPFLKQAAQAAVGVKGNKLATLVAKIRGEGDKTTNDGALRQKVLRAHARLTSQIENIPDEEKADVIKTLSATKRFVSNKRAKKGANKRGSYRRKE